MALILSAYIYLFHLKCYLAHTFTQSSSPPQGLLLTMLKLALLMALVLPAAVLSEGHEKDVENGVKLCGREFIRTVVSSCGGSRWKRYSPESGKGRTNTYRELLDWLNSDHFFMLPDQMNSLPDGEKQEGQDSAGDTAFFGSSAQHNLLDGTSHEEEENSHLTAASPRGRRNAGPGGSCCRRGCTKSELVRFC